MAVKKISLALTTSLLSGLLVLAGCGSSTGPSSNAQGSGGSGTGSGGQKTLIFGRSGDSVTLDPSGSTDDESNMVDQEIYETLVTYKPGTSQLIPNLATKWEVSKDGLSVTFHLQHGVKFQDGTPFNADAVVFNFQRWWDPKNPYHTASSFAHFQSDLGGLKGSKGVLIKDIKKIDDYTVRIDLTRPYAPFVAMLAQTAFSIASPADIKKYHGDIRRHPVGTGPFKFVSWAPNDKIVLQKFKGYRKPGLPKVDKVVFQVILDNKARLNALQAGQIDIMEGVNPSDAATVKSDPNLKLYVSPSNNVGYLAFNTQKAPFNNRKVRQAISLVIDKPALIKAYYNGMAVPATTLLPPKNWAFDSGIKNSLDVAKAKQLLAEAGFPHGFKTELWAMPVARPYMPQPDKIAEAIQADLKQIGIDAKIVSFDWATYLQKTDNGEHPMCLLGWSAGTWDPATFLNTLTSSANAKPPAENDAFYKNPEVDQLLTKALTVTDEAKRTEYYKQIQQILSQDVPYVPLVHSEPLRASTKYVTGYTPSITGGAELATVDITK
jgi:peptide/nickel transport system substrate-binding protein